jgi:hypothetical protein
MNETNIIIMPRESISITLFDDWRILKKGEAEDDNYNDLEGLFVGSGYLFSFDDSSNRLFKSTECDQVPIDLENIEIIKRLDIVKGCAFLNEKQLKRIIIEIEFWRKNYSPGDNYSLVQSIYLREIIEVFREWYKINEIEFPISDKLVNVEEITTEAQHKYAELKNKYDKLEETFKTLGLYSLLDDKPLKKYMLMVVYHLKEIHGADYKVSVRSLHSLSPKIKAEAKAWLMAELGNKPDAIDICKNVFKKPRIKTNRDGEEYSIGDIE